MAQQVKPILLDETGKLIKEEITKVGETISAAVKDLKENGAVTDVRFNGVSAVTDHVAKIEAPTRSEFTTLSTLANQTAGEVNHHHSSIAYLDSESRKNSLKISNLETTTSNLVETVKEQKEDIVDLKDKNQKIETEVEALKTDVTGLETKVTVIESKENVWDAKQDAISDLGVIRSNANAGKLANDTIGGYGDVVTYNANDFATKDQGTKADSAIQLNDNITKLNNNAGYTKVEAIVPTTSDDTIEGFSINDKRYKLVATNGITGVKIGDIDTVIYPSTDSKIFAVGGTYDPVYNRVALEKEVNKKQNKLTAGTNITISSEGVISSTGVTSFGALQGQPEDNVNLKNSLDAKANTSDIADMATKTYVDTKTTDMATKTWVNSEGFLKTHQSLADYRKAADQDAIDATKVDKVTGKGLSEKDFTSAFETKLAGITDEATKTEALTTAPASGTALQGLKINGTEYKISTGSNYTAGDGIAISASNVISNSGVRSIIQDASDGHKLNINTNGTTTPIIIPDNDTTYTAEKGIAIATGNKIGHSNTALTPETTGIDTSKKNLVLKYDDYGHISAVPTTREKYGTVTLTTTWNYDSVANIYTQEVNIPIDMAITSNDHPTLDVLISDSTKYLSEMTAWSKVFMAETATNKIKFSATEATTTAITVQIRN